MIYCVLIAVLSLGVIAVISFVDEWAGRKKALTMTNKEVRDYEIQLHEKHS